MPGPAIHLIVNPAAGRGRARGLVERARLALERVGRVVVSETTHPGHETTLARQAANNGAKALVVHGGDGSVSLAARGLISEAADTPLAVLAAGTGNDFAKTLGAPVYDYGATAAAIADNRYRTIDAGSVDGIPFINSAGFGFDAEVLAHTLEPGVFRGTSVYVTSALRHLFGYRGFEAALSVGESLMPADSGVEEATASGTRADVAFAAWLTVVFANGRWFGGTFQIAPAAQLDDGLIDCIGIANASATRRMALFSRALRGAHVSAPEVRVHSASSYELQLRSAQRYQADGELRMSASQRVQIAVIRQAIRVVTA